MFLVAISLTVALPRQAAAGPAEDFAQRLTTLDGDVAVQHYELGVWCMEQRLYEEARDQFERALSLDPNHAEAARRMTELAELLKNRRAVPCEISLRNGERVTADLLMGSFKFQTQSGFLLIPANSIDLIEVGADGKPDHLLADNFIGSGRILADVFAARSKLGIINVKRIDVQTIRILRPCDACDGKGQLKCRRCNGKGRLSEKSVCPDCEGKGWTRCKTCGGTGKLTCPLCGGSGSFSGAWGRMRRVQCMRCNGTGKIDCTDCQAKGRLVCATCKGKPVAVTAGDCPVCQGKKTVACEVCGGTGIKPLPKEEDEKPPAPAPAPAPDAEGTPDPPAPTPETEEP